MSITTYTLLSAPLQKAITASVVGISAAAIPATIITVAPEKKDHFMDPINKQADALYKTIEEGVKQGTENVWNSYSSTYSETSETINQNIKNVGQALKKNGEVISSIAPYLAKEKIEGYNYHAFNNREVINALIKSLPIIVRDSIKDRISEGENYELLSLRKIYYIVSHPEFKKLAAALSELGKKKDKILDQTTKEDAQGIIEVLRSLPFEEGESRGEDDKSSPRINRFIQEVTKHIEDINNDETRSYPTARDLVVDILNGKNSAQTTRANLEKVINQLEEKTQVLTEQVPVDSSHIESAKAILGVLKSILNAKEEHVQA